MKLVLLITLAALFAVSIADPLPVPASAADSTALPIMIPPGLKRSEATPVPAISAPTAGVKVPGSDPATATGIAPQFTASAATWRTTTRVLSFGGFGTYVMASPDCPAGYEATACGSYTGWTTVVSLGTYASNLSPPPGGKAIRCTCVFYNTYSGSTGSGTYYCQAYCQ